MIHVALTVNGVGHEVDVTPNLTLLEFIREALYLTGTKEGCGVGECGMCLVLVDGTPVNSCLMLVADADGREIETIEGLADEGELDTLQAAFVKTGAIQCGYCTPSMVLAAEALLRTTPTPDPSQVQEALAGVLCRCGSYPKVLDAVRTAAAKAVLR
jgi:aerobic-type carbon monoxide dehydrogenase small subunit (CoxS/CutS family)